MENNNKQTLIDRAQEFADQADIPVWLALDILEEQDLQPVPTEHELFNRFMKHFQGVKNDTNSN